MSRAEVVAVEKRAQLARILSSAEATLTVDVGTVTAASELAFDSIAEMVDRYHGVADTQKRAEEHIGRALEAIAPFPDGPAREALFAAAKFSVLRDR